LTSLSDICDNRSAMALRYLRICRVILLIVVAGAMLAAGSAWAAHDCCGHPYEASKATGSGNESQSSDGDCVCTCCQAVEGISFLPGLSFQTDSWWSVEKSTTFPASRFETDIFRPPLA